MENSIEIINGSKENCPLMFNCLLKVALNVATNDFLDSLNRQTIHDLVKNLSSFSTFIKTDTQKLAMTHTTHINKFIVQTDE